MNPKQRLAQMETELAEVRIQRRARTLAKQLIPILQIPEHGIQLIHWLARDPRACRSNFDALVDWVEVQLRNEDFRLDSMHTPEFDLLQQSLNRRLAIVESSYT